MKKLAALLLLLLAGCGSAGKPHAFRIVNRGEGGLNEYRFEWRDSKTAISIGPDPVRVLLSPDRRTAALGGDAKLVDLVHRRVYVPKIAGPLDNCAASPLLWKRQDRLVFTVWCGSVHLTTRSELLVFDPRAKRFVGRREIGPGSMEGVRTAHDYAVLLTPPPLGTSSAGNLREERLGPARFIRVRPSGGADEITLPIRMGSARGRTFNRFPAFAVDSSRRHVYVLGEDDGVVRVDAVTLQAEPARLRHAFAAQRQLASTPRPHLGTTNPARTLERHALWLGGGLLAVTGSDTWSPRGYDRSAPAGLKLVDTGHWTVRLLNSLISTVTRAPGGFLATGPGAGLIAYDRKGHVRGRWFARKFVWVMRVSGHRAQLAVRDNENGPLREAVIGLPR